MKLALATAGIVAAIGAAAFVTVSNEPAPSAPAAERVAPQPQPLSAGQARALLAGGAVLADVREPDELAATGKLEGALNVPLTRLKQLAAQGSTAGELEAARARPVILYCRSGRRADEAGRILLSQGFSQVYNLGGFEDAVKAGLPAS